MNNLELMTAMQTQGNLIFAHVGESKKRPELRSYRIAFAMVIDNELHVRKYEDPGHGWLAIPVQWLEEFGIFDKISAFSYVSRNGGTAYLEEDCDASEFMKSADKFGFKVFIDFRHTNKSSTIRSYASFSAIK